MALSRRGIPLNGYGLSSQIKKRINELVSLQLTPTTINLFTAEFSKMDEEIKINIGMYIAQLLEIENALLEQHFNNLRESNSHGNSRDHLIMEQRKANLMRIQQIFTQEVQRQERIGEQMTLKSQYEAQLDSSLGTLDIKSAMVTNPSKMSLLEMERVHQAQVANIRRNKELYDFEIAQIQKLLARYQAENNVQKILELQNRVKIIEQEYLLRRDSMLRTINVHQQQMDVQAGNEGKKSKAKKVQVSQQQQMPIPQIVVNQQQPVSQMEDIYSNEDFFDVDTIEIQNVSNGKQKKVSGKNVDSKIPNEVLSDSTISFGEISVSQDISNPNEKSPLSEIDRILEETEKKTITTKKAEKENDPFLLLLARDQELKIQKEAAEKNLLEAAAQTKAFREAIMNQQNSMTAEKVINKKGGAKKAPAKKLQEEDSATTSSETKKINDNWSRETSTNRVNTNKSKVDNFKVKQQQEIIQLKNEQLKLKDERFKSLQDEKRELLKRISALEKSMNSQKPIKEIQVREVIVKDDSAIKELKNENKMLVKRLQNLETAFKKDNERLKQNKTNDATTKEYISRITLLEKENKVLSDTISKNSEISEQAQQKKAQLAVNSLRNIYVERLKGINLLNSLRVKQKLHYESIEKDNHVRDDASAALNNLFTKQKAHIVKKDLVKKEKIQELKHDILVQEDIKAKPVPETELKPPLIDNVSVVDELINDMIVKTDQYSDDWESDETADDLIAVTENEILINSSVFEETASETNLDIEIPTERFIREENEKKEMQSLERKAKLHLISIEEMEQLKTYQEKYKKDKGLKAYRLITSYKK